MTQSHGRVSWAKSPAFMTKSLFVAVLGLGSLCAAARAETTPRIRFDQTVFDFGKTSQVQSVSGTFKFKNVGDGTLKVQPPKPSCGCTLAGLKPDTLLPGESGELAFTLYLGFTRAQLEKHIEVQSNDPQTPNVSLTVKADYTPLYEITPMILTPNLPFGLTATNVFTSITRTDGKPLRNLRLEPSKPWIAPQLETPPLENDTNARVRIEVRREGTPRRFNEFIQVHTADHTNGPVSTIFVYGRFLGELSLNPEALYWMITDPAKVKAERPDAVVIQRMTIGSATGKAFEIKNPQSTVKGVKLEIVPKEPGKVYELVAKLEELPEQTVGGNVSFETSVEAQPKIDVPVIVNVSKP